MAAPHPSFGSRSAYAGAGTKLAERPNAVPFSASAFSRNRGVLGTMMNNNNNNNNNPDSAQQQPQSQQPQLPPVPPTHSHSHTQNHASAGTMMGPDAVPGGGSGAANPLSRLTEEQREEINEAVSLRKRKKKSSFRENLRSFYAERKGQRS